MACVCQGALFMGNYPGAQMDRVLN